MNKSTARILWTLARTTSTLVAEGETRMMAAARELEVEEIVTLTARGDGTYLVRLIRDTA